MSSIAEPASFVRVKSPVEPVPFETIAETAEPEVGPAVGESIVVDPAADFAAVALEAWEQREFEKAAAYDGVPDRDAFDRLNRLVDAGPFEVHVARRFPLARAADAHHALETHYLGKLALVPRR